MAHIATTDVNAWLQDTKLDLSTLDAALEAQIATQVFAKLSLVFDPTTILTWEDTSDTPKLIKSIIAMYYAGWTYDLNYADEAENNSYANRLRRAADLAIEGLIEGTVFLEELPTAAASDKPTFFPNDLSSAQEPTTANPSDGPPYYLIGQVF